MNAYRIALIALLGIMLAACALQPVAPSVLRDRPAADFSSYGTIQVIVEPYQGGSASHGFDITSAELRVQFIDNLRAAGKVAVAETEAQGGQVLEARLSIDALNYVSGAARGTTGILAGRAVLNASMTLKDKQTGAVIDVVRANHASSHTYGVFGATTGRQVTAVAKEFSSRLVSVGTAAPAATAPAPSTTPASQLSATEQGAEAMFWESIRASKDPADFRAYLERYPNGNFVALARNRLAALGQ